MAQSQVETEIHGFVAPGFEGIRRAFESNFSEGRERGAACCLYAQGRRVVDLWGGVADPESGRPYDVDTLQLVFSTTKGATALCANLLAQRGELDLGAPVSDYWPEFAAAGKGSIPVRWLLDHRAGLIDVDRVLTFSETLAWDPVVEALAAQTPLWEPGAEHGYHATTYGWLVGEVVRRVTGRSLGRFFAEEVAAPLGLDFWIGLPPEEQARVAPLVHDDRHKANLRKLSRGALAESLLSRSLKAPSGVLGGDVWNRPDLRAAEIPAGNGVGNARSIARMYASMVGEVDGVRLLSPDQVAQAAITENQGRDRCVLLPLHFGIGFMKLSALSRRFGPGAIGHYGMGGSMGFADPEYQIGFSYVPNKMELGLVGDPRSVGLLREVNAAIGRRPESKSARSA